MPDWFWYLVVFGYGAIVGSFLNVLIYRMPLGMSISSPPSHCPRCHTRLGLWDNIPLIAFLTLGARCRYCRTPISWRYFSVELLTASLWVALFARISGETGISWVDFVAQALFASILVAVIFIDLDHFIIPDELNWVGMALALGRDIVCLGLAWYAGRWAWWGVANTFFYGGWLPRALVGAAVYGGVLFLVSFLSWVYYAREEGESLGQVARRFFVFEEEEPEADNVLVPVTAGTEAVAEPSPAGGEAIPTEDGEGEGEEEAGEPARLRFSPAFLAFLSALLLIPVLKGGAVLAFVGPALAFVLLSRRPGEPPGAALARFFRADDQAGTPETETMPAIPEPMVPVEEGGPAEPLQTGGEDVAIASGAPEGLVATATQAVTGTSGAAPPYLEEQLAAEADQFAREAESGQHGGMGLGDVKLALAIGALLGPGQALLSLLLATAAGAVTGIGMALRHGKGLRQGIPFGPFMAFGAVVVMLYGPDLVAWYLRLTGLGGPPPVAR